MRLWFAFKKNKILSILLLALIIRLLYWLVCVYIGGTEVYISTDTPSYVNVAKNIVTGNGFANATGLSEIKRTPGYPLIIALFMVLLGDDFTTLLIPFQILLGVVSVFFMYKIALLIADSLKFNDSIKSKMALLSALFGALNLNAVVYCIKILTDGSSQCCLMIAIYFFAKALICNNKRPINIVLFAAFLSFSILIRPANLYLPIALILGTFIVCAIQKEYKRFIYLALSLVLALFPAWAWTIRNSVVSDFDGYSSISAINLYTYGTAGIYAKQNGIDWYEANAFLQSEQDTGLKEYLETMPRFDAYNKRAIEIIKSDIPEFTKEVVVI